MSYNVNWPPLLLQMMQILKATVFLDLFRLPGVSCLWAGASFLSRLLLYTVVPIVAVACLGLPVMATLVCSVISTPIGSDEILSRFQKTLNVFLFLIYSVVSVVTLEAFDCNPPGLGLLTADFREQCPADGSFLRVYSVIFIIVYPVGVPIFILASMIFMGVHDIAQDKRNAVVVSALIGYFLRKMSLCRPGSDEEDVARERQLATIFLDPDAPHLDPDAPHFGTRVKEVFDTLQKDETANSEKPSSGLLTSDLKKLLLQLLAKNSHNSASRASANAHISEMTADKDVNLKDLERLALRLVLTYRIFTGKEDGRTLTTKQAAYLLAFCEDVKVKDKRVDDENESKFPSQNMNKFRELLNEHRTKTDPKASMRQQVIFVFSRSIQNV